MSCYIAFLFITPLQSVVFNFSFGVSPGDHLSIDMYITLITAFDKIVLGHIKLFSDSGKSDEFGRNSFRNTGEFF